MKKKSEKNTGKVLLISDWAPPMLDGPSIILGNILREFKPEDLVLYTRRLDRHTKIFCKKGNEVDVKRYAVTVPSPHAVTQSSFLRRIFRVLEVVTIPFTTIKGLLIALKEKPDYILATSDIPHGHFMIAAFFIAAALRKKLFFYLFDPIEEFASSRMHRVLMRYFEPRMFNYASGVITMNNHLARHYKEKYEIDCRVLHHSYNNPESAESKRNGNNKNKDFKVVFPGNVSKYQLDALLNLKKALQLVKSGVQLVIYTPVNQETLNEYGLNGDNIIISHVDHQTLEEELKKADLLFLPLSFENAASIIVKAAFPSKTMDYMASGRPIIVHAPADCFIAEYAREKKFAEVVTDNNIVSLANAIESLLVNHDRQEELIRNSYKTLLNHDSKLKYRELISILEG